MSVGQRPVLQSIVHSAALSGARTRFIPETSEFCSTPALHIGNLKDLYNLKLLH